MRRGRRNAGSSANCENDMNGTNKVRGRGQKRKSSEGPVPRGQSRGRRGSRAAKKHTSRGAARDNSTDMSELNTTTNATRLVACLETSVDVLILNSSDDENADSDDCDIISEMDSHKENRTNNIIHNISSPLRPKSPHNCDVDSDEDEKTVPLVGFDPAVTFSDSDSDDLYSVNHNAIKASAEAAAVKGLQETQYDEPRQSFKEKPRPWRTPTNSSHHICSETSSTQEIHNLSDDDGYNAFDSLCSSPEINDIELSKRKMVKMTKKTEKLFEKVEKLGKKLDDDFELCMNKSVDGEDDSLLIMSEEDLNPTIFMSVRYGLQFTKIPIKKHDKFGLAYVQLADQHGVKFDDVVLSLRDTLLSHDQTPADVQLSIVDIVECGIIRQCDATADACTNSTDEVLDPNIIQLKFQCSARRGVLHININKFEKMSVAMQSYSDQKGIDQKTLKFIFDGERLNANDTAITLDLEGGECIDVFQA